jgi:transposase
MVVGPAVRRQALPKQTPLGRLLIGLAAMAPRKPYSTDLTDNEWACIQHLVPTAKPGGCPEKYPKREILNGIFYVVRSGCAWRLLPHDLPPWQIVYHYFWLWRRDGTWQYLHDMLRGASIASPSRPPQKGGPRLRCAQTCQRPQAPYPRRYLRVVADRRGHGGQRARPCCG